MGARFKFASTVFAVALLAAPTMADKKGRHGDEWHGKHAAHCPPGLAKKNPPCMPPGKAKKHDHHHRVGDRLDLDDYILIRDPGRYGLDARDGWNYYRDSAGIYRVDPGTRKILAVIELLEAFAN